MTDCGKVFTDLYARKAWGEGSGGGSGPEASKPWAEAVSSVIAILHPKTVLSIGCGDGWADAEIRLQGALYIGVDVVPGVIAYCRSQYSERLFVLCDAVERPWFGGYDGLDLVLCKEVTQHLDDTQLSKLVKSLERARAVIHCSALSPGDVIPVTGGYRPVKLSAEPWNLPTQTLAEWSWGETKYQAELWLPSNNARCSTVIDTSSPKTAPFTLKCSE